MVRAQLYRVAEVLLPSLGAAAFCSKGFRAAGLAMPVGWVTLTGIFTLAVYLFYYSWPPDGAQPTFTAKWGIRLSALCVLVGAYGLWQRPEVGLLYGISAVLPLMYINPKLPIEVGNFPERLLSHKPLFLALVWIWGAFLLPWLGAGNAWQAVPWHGLMPYWINLFGLCLLFSWRDRQRDAQALWLKGGWKKPRLLIALLAVGFAMSVWAVPVFPVMAVVQAGLVLACCLLTRAQPGLAYLLADASMLFWWC